MYKERETNENNTIQNWVPQVNSNPRQEDLWKTGVLSSRSQDQIESRFKGNRYTCALSYRRPELFYYLANEELVDKNNTQQTHFYNALL